MVFLSRSQTPFLHDYSKSVETADTGLSIAKLGGAVVESKERSASFLQTLPLLEDAEAHYWQNFPLLPLMEKYQLQEPSNMKKSWVEPSQTCKIYRFQWCLYIELEAEVSKALQF